MTEPDVEDESPTDAHIRSDASKDASASSKTRDGFSTDKSAGFILGNAEKCFPFSSTTKRWRLSKGIPADDKFSWEFFPKQPVLLPPAKEKDYKTVLFVLQLISLIVTLAISLSLPIILVVFMSSLSGRMLGGFILMMILFFISSICQAISMFFVSKRKYFSLAIGGAVFSLYFFPISFVIIGLLIYQRRFFYNPFDG